LRCPMSWRTSCAKHTTADAVRRGLGFPAAKTPPRDAGMSRRLDMSGFCVSGLTPRGRRSDSQVRCLETGHQTLTTNLATDVLRRRSLCRSRLHMPLQSP